MNHSDFLSIYEGADVLLFQYVSWGKSTAATVSMIGKVYRCFNIDNGAKVQLQQYLFLGQMYSY